LLALYLPRAALEEMMKPEVVGAAGAPGGKKKAAAKAAGKKAAAKPKTVAADADEADVD